MPAAYIDGTHTHTMLIATPDEVARFMRYVEVLPSGCWYWTGARSRGAGNRKWYGSFKHRRRGVRAHRFAADVLGKKHCPKGCHRDHTCSFSMCVNPGHIEIVTHAENETRKKARRRPPTLGGHENVHHSYTGS